MTATLDEWTRYLDRIEIDAGPLTLLVVAFAGLFHRYRQRPLAPVLAATAAAADGQPA